MSEVGCLGVPMGETGLPESPIRIDVGANSAVASYCGELGAIFIQKMDYYLRKSGHSKDGSVWVFNSIQDWIKEHMSWAKYTTVQRVINRLVADGVLKVTNYFSGVRSRKRWYTLDYHRLMSLLGDKALNLFFPAKIVAVADRKDKNYSALKCKTEPTVEPKKVKQTIAGLQADTILESLSNIAKLGQKPVKAKVTAPMLYKAFRDQFIKMSDDPIPREPDMKTLGQCKLFIAKCGEHNPLEVLSSVMLEWDNFRDMCFISYGATIPKYPSIDILLFRVNLSVVYHTQAKTKGEILSGKIQVKTNSTTPANLTKIQPVVAGDTTPKKVTLEELEAIEAAAEAEWLAECKEAKEGNVSSTQ